MSLYIKHESTHTLESVYFSTDTVAIEFPAVKRTPDMIAVDNSAANAQMCAQMRTIGVQYMHFTGGASEYDQICAKRLNRLYVIRLQISRLQHW